MSVFLPRSFFRLLLPAAAASFCLYLAFFPFFSSGFDRLSGDLGDNRLYLVVLEHWRAVIRGEASWADPNFFYPLPHVLGFSDAMALYVPPYLFFRSLGADRYFAFEGCLILFRLLGFAGMHLFLRKGFGFPLGIAIFGASLFSLSNMYSVSLGHPQLASLALIPVLAWLAVVAFRLRTRRRGMSLVITGAAAFLFGALVLTSYYVAFFCVLFIGATLLLRGVPELIRGPRESVRRMVSSLRATAAHIVVGGVCLIPWMCIFAALYMPVVSERGERPFWEVQTQTLAPTQIINPGPTNVVWGDLVRLLPGLFQLDVPRETGRGWPLVTFVVFVAIGVGWIRRGRWLAAISMAVLLLALTATGALGFYPWRAIYVLVPGAGGVRVPGRLNLVLNVAVVALVAEGFRRWFRSAGTRGDFMSSVKLCGLCAVMLLEQLNVDAFPGYSHREEMALFQRVSKAPAACRSFYVAHSTRPSADWRTIDAMLLAREQGIPTINGYSGIVPTGGGCPNDENRCEQMLLAWAKEHGVTDGLCELDLSRGKWIGPK